MGDVLGLVLNALRARRAQSLALFALTVLAGLGASAAPWFAGWARDAVTDANIADAPAEQRVVSAAGAVRFAPNGPNPLQALRDRVAQSLTIPDSRVVVGARLYTTATRAGESDGPAAGVYLNYRDDVCAQLVIEGTCPTVPGEVLLGRATADNLGLGIGGEVRFEGFRLPAPVTLRLSGVYEVADLLATYWAGTDLLSGPAVTLGATVDDPAFASEQTLFAAAPAGLDMDLHLVLPDSAFHATDVDLGDTLARATGELRQSSFEVRTEAKTLVEQIDRDQRLVALGIGVAATQLVLLCWIGLLLAVRHTSDDRRGDIGLLKLRGAAPWRIWTLTAQQSALPMLAGAVTGWGLGFLAAGALAGTPSGPLRTIATSPSGSLRLSLAAAGLACIGALVAAVVAEWRTLGAPVVTLLRRVPGRHRGWRADVVDLVVVLLAIVGVYQGHAELSADGEPSVLALLAPALVGLAVALLVARALPAISTQAGVAALRSGRAGLALASLHLARRPGTNRIFTVLAVAVSVFATVVLYWHTATVAWSDRAAQELGAARVLSVRAVGGADLMRAVREVDPQGRYAMAVARTEGVRTEDRVVAVDTTRLGAVADAAMVARTGLGTPARLAELLHPATPAVPVVADGAVLLDAVGPVGLAADETVGIQMHLATVDGTDHVVDFGPIGPGRRGYQATVSGCPAPGCRLVALELVAPRLVNVGREATVEVHGLTQPGDGGVDPDVLSDATRWRPQLGVIGIGPVISTRDGRLSLSLYTGPRPPGQRLDQRVLVNAAPTPLPIVLAGPRPEQRRAGDDRVTVLGGARVPYQVVASVPVLPRVGDVGAIVDLEYALRSNDAPGESAALEVWLTADAPESVLTGLRERGVRILAEDTVDDRAQRLARHGPGLALRFELFASIVLLLLAAGTLVVAATVERGSRVEELRALRAQGLPRSAVTVAGYAGVAALVGMAQVTGMVAALVAQAAVTASLPVFADGWSLLPLPSGVAPVPFVAAAISSLVVLGAAAVAGAARVVEAVLGRRGAASPVLAQRGEAS